MVTKWDELPLTLTPKDLWERGILPLGKQAVYNLCRRPGFPAVQITGRKFVIPRDRLRAWLEKEASR